MAVVHACDFEAWAQESQEMSFAAGFSAGEEVGRLLGRIEALKEASHALLPGYLFNVGVCEAKLAELLAKVEG